MEIWKICEGEYEISNLGNLRRDGSAIKPRLDRYGYLIVTLWIKGVCCTRKIHRLVAHAFIENPENKAQVNHTGWRRAQGCKAFWGWSTHYKNKNARWCEYKRASKRVQNVRWRITLHTCRHHLEACNNLADLPRVLRNEQDWTKRAQTAPNIWLR